MILIEHDERLVALDDEATKAVVWNPKARLWRVTGDAFPRKAFVEGRELSTDQAARIFKGADLEEAGELLK
jgi:hypothetical protein